MNDFNESSILITGAGGLLGTAQVRSLLNRNAKLIALDVDQTALDRLCGEFEAETGMGRLITLTADITDPEKLREQLSGLLESRNVQGLVNNAAVNPKVEAGLPRRNSLSGLDWPKWENELKVGLFGAYNCSLIIGEHMLGHGLPSSVVNLSSDYGHLAPKQSLYFDGTSNPPIKPPIYIAVKHGIVGLTRYFASFWAGTNIRVNAIAPGGIANGQSPGFVEALSLEVPIGRMASVEELDGPIAFLLSEESSYVNGIELLADGGRAIW